MQDSQSSTKESGRKQPLFFSEIKLHQMYNNIKIMNFLLERVIQNEEVGNVHKNLIRKIQDVSLQYIRVTIHHMSPNNLQLGFFRIKILY